MTADLAAEGWGKPGRDLLFDVEHRIAWGKYIDSEIMGAFEETIRQDIVALSIAADERDVRRTHGVRRVCDTEPGFRTAHATELTRSDALAQGVS